MVTAYYDRGIQTEGFQASFSLHVKNINSRTRAVSIQYEHNLDYEVSYTQSLRIFFQIIIIIICTFME